MLLYLAGLKGVDPALKEAASIDGASEVRTFFQVVFPVMFPINVVVLVITFIDSLRAFDLVWVINRGRNGLELLASEVTRNIVGEAQRIGFGSALATIGLTIPAVAAVSILIGLSRGAAAGGFAGADAVSCGSGAGRGGFGAGVAARPAGRVAGPRAAAAADGRACAAGSRRE